MIFINHKVTIPQGNLSRFAIHLQSQSFLAESAYTSLLSHQSNKCSHALIFSLCPCDFVVSGF